MNNQNIDPHTLLLIYCRSGFEDECSEEIHHYLHKLGYQCERIDSSSDAYIIMKVEHVDFKTLESKMSFDEFVFPRQILYIMKKWDHFSGEDRVSPFMDELQICDPSVSWSAYSDIFFESPDTNEGKKMQKFFKKFSIPFQNRLKKIGFKKVYSKNDRPRIHVFFDGYQKAMLATASPLNSSPYPMGIRRLKFPADAPSRSTLKLEEAFHSFLSKSDQEDFLSEGRTAVDLGAAPGGWSYQFVQRGISVTAIDNGNMDDKLLSSHLLTHLKQDAFKYETSSQVDWLVCDMVEKPSRIAQLIGQWFHSNDCRLAIVNFKLPMKHRWKELLTCLDILRSSTDQQLMIRAKHLYHDREEVSVFIKRMPN